VRGKGCLDADPVDVLVSERYCVRTGGHARDRSRLQVRAGLEKDYRFLEHISPRRCWKPDPAGIGVRSGLFSERAGALWIARGSQHFWAMYCVRNSSKYKAVVLVPSPGRRLRYHTPRVKLAASRGFSTWNDRASYRPAPAAAATYLELDRRARLQRLFATWQPHSCLFVAGPWSRWREAKLP
jgi:hypothetical protein